MSPTICWLWLALWAEVALVALCDDNGSSMWDEVADGQPVDGAWSKWSGWSDTCSSSGARRRVVKCNNPAPQNGGSNCQYFEEVRSCFRSFRKASLPWCQFSVLSKQSRPMSSQGSDDLANTNERFKECERDANCVGFYLDGNDGNWHTLPRLLPTGRRFFEEGCSTASRTKMELHIHMDRFSSYFTCDRIAFNKEGLPKSGVRYSLNMNKVTRPNAMATCDQMGSKLVEIESPEELSKVQEMLTTGDWCHTGAQRNSGSDGRSKESWYWRYSQLPASHNWLWSQSQPDASGEVGQLFPKLMDDFVPEQANIFICECQDPLVEFMD